MKMCKLNYFSLFWKSYLVLFLTFIITPVPDQGIAGLGPSLWGEHVPQHFGQGGQYLLSSQHFVIKSNVVVQISCYFTMGGVSPALNQGINEKNEHYHWNKLSADTVYRFPR